MMIRVHTFGMVYGTQQSIIEEVVEDELYMPVLLLHEADRELGQTAVQAVKDAEKAVDALGWLAADLGPFPAEAFTLAASSDGRTRLRP
jgi:CRISPR system Cascade subunit CasA